MCDHDDQAIPGDLLEDLHDLNAGFCIQSTGRLVRQNDVRIVDQCPCDCHTLHLSAGHLTGLFGKLVAQPHIFQRFFGTLPAFCLGHTGQRQSQFHVLQHSLVGDQVITLEHEADRVISIGVPVAVFEILGGASVDNEVALGVLIQPADNVQHGSLAAAGRSQNGNEFVPSESQVNAFQSMDGVFSGEIVFFDAF